ncbi:hypothetical protein DPMN_161865 [Dreissena polymorpha]|uniref:Uncharacterized protein n=1 Tax=Dreissena polymorpha TaxID=45954 RepID=A0A9D4ETT0_DREPO|nr:hypothetical protein DPMN_161865 [Dreissena polymorpha]
MPEHFPELSIRMSVILNDSGAGKDTVMDRRKTYLWRECMTPMGSKQGGNNGECFHFGSQSEGTTTPGLQSDIDYICSDNNVNSMRVRGDWKAGSGTN